MSLTDFNDLHVTEGLDVVRAQLEAALAEPMPAPLALVEQQPQESPPLEAYEDEISRALDVDCENPDAPKRFGSWIFGDMLADIYLIYGTDCIWDARERIQMRLSHLRHIVGKDLYKRWEDDPRRKITKGLVFEPSGDVPENHLNIYDKLPLTPDTRGAGACQRIIEHVYHLCGKRDKEFVWLLKWMAYPLQHPGAKMATSVIMYGSEGPGKSLLLERIIKKIYGDYGVTIGQAQVESQFTGWQSHRCFALCEEVVARSEKSHYKGMLKHLVTGQSLMINEKNLPLREEANHMNMVFLSNSMVPMELDLGDRRYLVLSITDVPPQKYFTELFAEINSGGVEAFYHHLLTIPLGDFHEHTKPPMNEEKRHLVEASLPNPVLFYQDWKAGDLELPFGACAKADFYAAYRRWCEQRNEFKKRERDVTTELRRFMSEGRGMVRLPHIGSAWKTIRYWVPLDDTGKHQTIEAADIEKQCQEFHGEIRRLKKEEADDDQ